MFVRSFVDMSCKICLKHCPCIIPCIIIVLMIGYIVGLVLLAKYVDSYEDKHSFEYFIILIATICSAIICYCIICTFSQHAIVQLIQGGGENDPVLRHL